MASETITRNDLTAILNEVLPSPQQILQKTVTFTTNSVGRVSGSTADLIGVADATIICFYFERGSYSANRSANIFMYGGAGYTLEFLDGGSPVANASVTAKVSYFV